LAALDPGGGGHQRRPRCRPGQVAGQIAQRQGVKIARVALVRRLLALCHYALRDDGGYRAYPATAR